jgi:hypothetical protein
MRCFASLNQIVKKVHLSGNSAERSPPIRVLRTLSQSVASPGKTLTSSQPSWGCGASDMEIRIRTIFGPYSLMSAQGTAGMLHIHWTAPPQPDVPTTGEPPQSLCRDGFGTFQPTLASLVHTQPFHSEWRPHPSIGASSATLGQVTTTVVLPSFCGFW